MITCYVAMDVADGASVAASWSPDIALLGPEPDGRSLAANVRRLRERATTPLIVFDRGIHRRGGLDERVAALREGADDALAADWFHLDELLARIGAVVRRWRGFASDVVSTGNLTLDLGNMAVTVAGRRLPVPRRPFQLLAFLVSRADRLVSRRAIMDELYGGRDEPAEKIVDVFICQMRRRLERAGCDRHIETVWGHGWMLADGPADIRTAGFRPIGVPSAETVTFGDRVVAAIGAAGDIDVGALAQAMGERLDLVAAIAAKLGRAGFAEQRRLIRPGRPTCAAWRLTASGEAWRASRAWVFARAAA